MTIPPPRLEQQKQERAIQLIEFLDGVSESLLRLSPRQFIEQLPDQICEILSVSDCMLWTADHTKGSLKIKQISKELKPEALNDELDLSDPSVNGLFSVETTSFLSKSEHLFKQIASVNNWKSSLSYPIKSQSEDHPLGLLLVLTEVKRDFNKSEKRLLKILANYAALSLEQEKNDEVRRRTESLVSLMQEMTTVEEVKELWPLIRKATKTLSNSDYVWAGQWDHVRGILIGNDNSDQENENLHISIGDGITGRVIATEKPQLIGDVLKEPSYIELWPNIRSELTVPILIEKIPIREGIKIGFGSKVFGVLDLESPQINAFSKYDQQLLDVFGRYAAILLSKLEFEEKLKKIRHVERKLIQATRVENILETLGEGVIKIFGFTWVNISMITQQNNELRIKSEYVYGEDLNKSRIANFKKAADYFLDSNDIQSSIVRSREIEVPPGYDERFDPKIYREFGHDQLIRVWLPMIEFSTDRVIGTLETGYKRKYRPYIYEQDIQLLKNLVEKAVNALEVIKSGWIDQITHELKSPVIAIRNNTNFLQSRLGELCATNQNKMNIKFSDILVDSDLLLYQIHQIEYFLGKQEAQIPNLEQTNVFKDIIIKTIFHLIGNFRLDNSSIKYNPEDLRRVIVNTDKTMLSQVVYNLLSNAIKYAEKPSKKTLDIVLEVTEDKKSFIIKFKDQGIGVNPDYADKIFLQGFRAPEARQTDVKGSGLGLSISQKIMRNLGGDLTLAHYRKPTIFHLILPKNL